MSAAIADAITTWEPAKSFQTERDLVDALCDHLAATFQGAEIMKEYRMGTIRADIAIRFSRNQAAGLGWWILGGFVGGLIKSAIPEKHSAYIETKLGLVETSECERLIGQINLYRQNKLTPVIVVIYGGSNQQLVDLVRQCIAPYEDVTLILK